MGLTLGAKITTALGSKPQHGTVVRWVSRAGYLYMAVFVEGRGWYTTSTGNPYVAPHYGSSRDFLAMLERDAKSIGVTNDFEEVVL